MCTELPQGMAAGADGDMGTREAQPNSLPKDLPGAGQLTSTPLPVKCFRNNYQLSLPSSLRGLGRGRAET